MTLFAKAAMVLSWVYYAVLMGFLWLGQLFGLHNDVWDAFDFPVQDQSPPVWAILIGLLVSIAALISLGTAYRHGWRILSGSVTQDFRALAGSLGQMAWGLIGFWLGYNILSGAVQFLIVVGLPSTDAFDFGWDPLDIDIVFAITGIVLLAIARSLQRAWEAEDEIKHFL